MCSVGGVVEGNGMSPIPQQMSHQSTSGLSQERRFQSSCGKRSTNLPCDEPKIFCGTAKVGPYPVCANRCQGLQRHAARVACRCNRRHEHCAAQRRHQLWVTRQRRKQQRATLAVGHVCHVRAVRAGRHVREARGHVILHACVCAHVCVCDSVASGCGVHYKRMPG